LTPRDFNQEIFGRNNVRKLLPENYPHRNLARGKLRYPAHNQERRKLAQAISPSSWKIGKPHRKAGKNFLKNFFSNA
jgi:hypothetical protein